MTSGIKANPRPNKARLAALASLFVLSCAMLCAPAAYAAEGDLLQQVMQGLAQVKSSRASFVERKYLSIVSSPLEYTGGLAYNAPDKLEKRTDTPKPESMRLEGDKLTLTNAKKQTRVVMLSQYPLVRAFTESIRSVLAGDTATLNRYYKVSIEGSAADWKLLLVPTDSSMQNVIKQIQFSGGGRSVKTIEFTEKQGDRAVMTITEAGA